MINLKNFARHDGREKTVRWCEWGHCENQGVKEVAKKGAFRFSSTLQPTFLTEFSYKFGQV